MIAGILETTTVLIHGGEIDRHFVNYADGFTIPHTGSNLSLEFFGSGLQEITDESWRVENISLKTVSLLPEEDQTIFIERLYLIALNRRAEQNEMDSSLYAFKTDSGAKVVLDLFQGQEFIDLQLSNADFIRTLYKTLFDRLPDQEELSAWEQELESGKLREMAVYDFLRKQEFEYLLKRFDVVAFDEADNAVFQMKSFVNRFYQLVLNRNPDLEGFHFWSSRLADGTEAGGDIAQGFFKSAEFINRQTSDNEFLDIAYRSFFNREAGLEEKQYWIEALSSGASRLEIIDGFVESQEFINLANSFGIASSDADKTLFKVKRFVQRFYQLVLNRKPDAIGFNYWTSRLVDGSETGGDIARGFFKSVEFTNRQAADSEFLEIVYHSFFNREADLEGKQYWMNELLSGADRLDIVNGFIVSQEFIDLATQFGIKAE